MARYIAIQISENRLATKWGNSRATLDDLVSEHLCELNADEADRTVVLRDEADDNEWEDVTATAIQACVDYGFDRWDGEDDGFLSGFPAFAKRDDEACQAAINGCLEQERAMREQRADYYASQL